LASESGLYNRRRRAAEESRVAGRDALVAVCGTTRTSWIGGPHDAAVRKHAPAAVWRGQNALGGRVQERRTRPGAGIGMSDELDDRCRPRGRDLAYAAVTGGAVRVAASCGFMLPVGTSPNVIVRGTGRVTMRTMMRYRFCGGPARAAAFRAVMRGRCCAAGVACGMAAIERER